MSSGRRRFPNFLPTDSPHVTRETTTYTSADGTPTRRTVTTTTTVTPVVYVEERRHLRHVETPRPHRFPTNSEDIFHSEIFNGEASSSPRTPITPEKPLFNEKWLAMADVSAFEYRLQDNVEYVATAAFRERDRIVTDMCRVKW